MHSKRHGLHTDYFMDYGVVSVWREGKRISWHRDRIYESANHRNLIYESWKFAVVIKKVSS